MIKINFSDLLDQYDKDMSFKLRGFNNEEYLKFWVPASSKLKSLTNLIDALYESKFYKAIISDVNLSKNEELELSKLIDISIKKLTSNKIELDIDPKKYRKFFFEQKANRIPELKEKNLDEFMDALPELEIDESISQFYLDASEKHSPKCFKKKILNKNEKEFEIAFSNGEKVIYFVDKENMKITQAFQNNIENSKISKILDLFCEVILNKNFQEVSEHSMIYLENKLRELSDDIPKRNGIFLPSNSGGLFNYINKNLRNHFKDFLSDLNLLIDINKDYYEVSEDWKNKKLNDKKLFVNKVIVDDICRQLNLSSDDIKLNRIIQNNRFEFILSERLKKYYEENILFKIEKILKDRIDKSIELISVEEKDSNKLRLDNAPKAV